MVGPARSAGLARPRVTQLTEGHAMGLYFQSIRSSSSGNCLMLWSDRSAVVIDCGVKTQWECREAFAARVGGPRFDGVIISHAHSDHIGYPALKSLAKLNIPLYTHAHV